MKEANEKNQPSHSFRREDIEARSEALRHLFAPWYSVFEPSFGTEQERSLYRAFYSQYQNLTADKKLWLRAQTALWETATPQTLDDNAINQELMTRLKLQLLCTYPLNQVKTMDNQITELMNNQLLNREALQILCDAGVNTPVILESLMIAKEMRRDIVGTFGSDKFDHLLKNMIHHPDLSLALETWKNNQDKITRFISSLKSLGMVSPAYFIEILFNSGKEAGNALQAIMDDKIQWKSTEAKYHFMNNLSAACQSDLLALPNGGRYLQALREHPETSQRLVEGLVRAKGFGILGNESNQELLLSHPEHSYYMAGSIAALSQTLLWQEDATAVKHALVENVGNLDYLSSALNSLAQAGFFETEDRRAIFDLMMSKANTIDYDMAEIIEVALKFGLLNGPHAQNHLQMLLNLTNRENKKANDLHGLRIMIESAGKGGLLQGDKATANLEQLIAITPQSWDLRLLMNIGERTGLLPNPKLHSNSDSDSEDREALLPNPTLEDKQVLFDKIINLAHREYCGEVSKLASNMQYSIFDDSREHTPDAFRKKQQLLLALIEHGELAHEVVALNLEYYRKSSSFYCQYLIALLSSGENLQVVKQSLDTFGSSFWDHPNLVTACFDAIVKAGPFASQVGNGLKMNFSYGEEGHQIMLGYQEKSNPKLSESARLNINTIVEAGLHAEHVSKLLSLAHRFGLLNETGAEVRQQILQQKDNAEVIEQAMTSFRYYNSFDERAPLIFKKFLTATDPQALALLLSQLLSYPTLQDKALLTQTFALDVQYYRPICDAMASLEMVSPRFITSENYRLLLDDKENANLLALVLCGQASKDNLAELGKLHLFHELVDPNIVTTEAFFDLYQQLSKEPLLFSIQIIQGLLQLSIEDQRWLLALMNHTDNSEAMTQLLFDKEHGAVAHIIAQKYQLHHQYHFISSQNNMDLPQPEERESSMRDDYIKRAKERLEALPLFMRVNEAELQKMEITIRDTLLEAIINETPLKTSSPEQDSVAEKHHQEVVRFITEHREALADRSNDAFNQEAVLMMTELDSVAQTAWRAYEPLAQVKDWPNLLTESHDKSEVFSTAASRAGMGNTPTVASASTSIRCAAASIFRAINDPKLPVKTQNLLQTKFIQQIAEIRRAHNTKATSGIDSPSCFPGCWSRLGLILDAHPNFVQHEKLTARLHEIVEVILRGMMQKVVTDAANHASTDAERRLLLSAIRLYSSPFSEDALKDKRALEYNLSATLDDLKDCAAAAGLVQGDTDEIDDTQIQHYVMLAVQHQATLMEKIYDNIQHSFNDLFSAACTDANVSADIPKEALDYLIEKYLTNIASIVSIPGRIIAAASEKHVIKSSDSSDEGVSVESPESHRFLTSLRGLVDVSDATVDDKALKELSNRLQVLFDQLNASQSYPHAMLETKINTKLKDLSEWCAEELHQELPSQLTTKNIIAAIEVSIPNKITYPEPFENQARFKLSQSNTPESEPPEPTETSSPTKTK